MWKEYSKNYIKNNKAASISIMAAVFISSVFISAICTVFYNMWTDNIYRIVSEEGDWQAKVTGNISEEVVRTIENHKNVERVVLNQENQEKEAHIYFHDAGKIYEDMPEIVQAAGLYEKEGVTIQYHSMLLSQYYIYSPEEKRDPPLLLTFYLLVMVVVCVSLIMIIYNAFGISMNARLHQLGILQSVGATPKQIYTAIMQEALALSLLPVLFGITAGIGINYAFIQFANTIGDIARKEDAAFTYSPIILLITALICLFTVLWAAGKAAKKLSRVTPLEAIHNSTEYPVIKVKKFRLLPALFGIEGELAQKSLYTRRKAFRTAGISLTLSFLVFSIFMNFITLSEMSVQQSYFERYKDTWDIMISVKNEKLLLEKFRNTSGVSECISYQKADTQTWLDEKMLSGEVEAIGGLEILEGTGISKKQNRYSIKVPIVILDDDSFRAYCDSAGINSASFTGAAAVTVNRIWDNIHSDFRNREYLAFITEETNQILELFPDGDSGNGENTFSLKMCAFTDRTPKLREEYDNFALLQIMSDTAYKEMTDVPAGKATYFKLLVSSEEEIGHIQNKLEKLLEEEGSEYTIENRKEKEEYNNSAMRGWKIIMGLFCGMLAFIGIVNIFANTLGSVYQRRKEFARYSSIGLTPGGIKKILFMEALIIAAKPILIGIPANILFVIFAVYAKYNDFVKIMPIKPLIILVVFIVVSIGLAYYISGRKICRTDIIDSLKDDTMF